MAGRGDLRERITIQAISVASDGAGGEVRTWVNAGKAWAQILPSKPGSEAAIADGLQGVQGYRVKVPFRRDITIEHRIVWRDLVLNVIGAADETGKRKYTIISTDAGVVTA